jgi:phosphoribosyl 1,2-cyclic phosphodiesterase
VRLYLCGVRGSTPAPGADFLRYGGHTSCVAIAHDDAARPTLVLDAGTGLRQVTPLLGGQPFDGTILLTHLHWDHVHGLPFFTGGDCEGSRVSLLLPEQEDGASAEQALAKGMSPPHFPIGPSGLRGAWTFGTVAPGPLKAEGFTIEARAIPHKGGATLGYRVSDGSSVIAYLPDHCPTALGPGPEGWGEYHAAALELASGADVLLHDAFLLADEVPAEAFFGHAAIDYAIGLGRRAGARRVVLTHHKPGRTDAALDEVASRVAGVQGEVASRGAAGRGEVPGRPTLPEVIVAAEGEIFEL